MPKPKTTKRYARYYALCSAVDILRFHGFEPDPREIPDEEGRRMASEAFLKILNDLDAKASRAAVPSRTKGGMY
jgi:hypothetical protein